MALVPRLRAGDRVGWVSLGARGLRVLRVLSMWCGLVTALPDMCECFWTPPETWLSAASCGYGSGYEPGSQMEWNPDCPAHPGREAQLGRFLFDRQADSYEADSAMRELAWVDPDIRSFWIAEAGAVLEFIGGGL